MSYIPDYREQALTKFDEHDQEYLLGYRHAMEDAANFFDNADAYYTEENEQMYISDYKDMFEDWAAVSEIEVVCSMAEQEKYEGVEFHDENPPLYTGTKGALQ